MKIQTVDQLKAATAALLKHLKERGTTMPNSVLEELMGKADLALDAASNDGERSERELDILRMAKDEHEKEGECEIDDNAELSEGDDNGTYVQAWVWVSFGDTKYDKDQGACILTGEAGENADDCTTHEHEAKI